MGFELLIIVSLTLAATFIVVVVSVGLVIHKGVNARALQRRRRLHSAYSEILAELLLQELPTLPSGSKTSAIFDQYEAIIKPIKDRFQKLLPTKRKYEREALRLTLIDFARDVSGEVSDRLVYFFYTFDFVDDEIKLLSDRRWWIRAQAARDAGLLKARRAISALTASLEDEHQDVRIQAMESLVRLVGVDALQTIFRVSRNISQWTSVELSTIVMEYKEAAVPSLVGGLESTDQSVILFCIEMLAEIGFVTAVEPLRVIAQSYPNVAVRAKAIEALGRLGDERAENMLVANLDNPVPLIRLKSIEALGRIGAPQAVSKLAERLHHGEIGEKISAARAMIAAGEQGETSLQSLLPAGDSLTALVIQQVLEESTIVYE
jgi:hypothetical protein